MTLTDLPFFNACLNSLAAVLLSLGYWAIKRQQQLLHKKLMIAAFLVSTLFLVSYLIYHYSVGHVAFKGEGWLKTLYFFILIPHIILAVVMLPLILRTFYLAYKQDFVRHKKIARITLPIWLYVSVTGVLVYWFLYHL